ncbi:tRNA pseudouridine(38-40) synthase TruA [Aquisediminimonas sediminicola]|uniref:tRNA pseudouridine(38-40) synthase TruA n=1 Tax=Alteraquisediminimonas sediminicola TaxID=2676787 RepID=UPI001C8E92B6|nr:tRNA pseudouridine(38-40) synthase TruA [Aquisediminimonas sediminicola]
MTRFRLTIEFNGQPFMGWQRQNHGPSVQQVIEDAAKEITGDDVLVYAAGRTDAGVHAEAMVAHVDIAKPFTAFRLMEGLNARMRPHPVAIIACEEVAHDWHARFSCLGRRYIYRIVNRRAPLALDQGRAWRVPNPLDADVMHEAAQLLVGTHDFTTFRSVHCQSESAVKSIDRFTVTRIGEEIELDVEARSFLHHQVRSMTGCLMLVGKGQWSIDDLRAARDAKDRTALGFNAPPDGLYFIAARY